MARVLAAALRWLASKLGLLLLILAALLLGAWLREEWQTLAALRNAIAAQESLLAGLRTDLAAIEDEIAEDAARWSERMAQAAAPLRAELEETRARISAATPRWQEALRRFADLERQARDARRAADRARAEVEAQEAALRFWDRWLNPGKVAALELARARMRAADANAAAWESARERVAPRMLDSPLRPLQERQAALASDIAALTGSASPRHGALLAARDAQRSRIAELEGLVAADRERAEENPRARLLQRCVRSCRSRSPSSPR